MLVKVCGIFEEQNLRELLSLKPDLIGLNFYAQSKRYCRFSELPEDLYEAARYVGVFVNSDLDYIEEKTRRFNLSLLQLHGTESVESVRAVKFRLPQCKVIKAIAVEEQEDLYTLSAWADVADYLLFDKKDPAFGGSGKKFNWDLLRSANIKNPFFLAGGLGPEDVRALRMLSNQMPNLYSADINSRFEDRDGLKNVASVRRFLEELRS